MVRLGYAVEGLDEEVDRDGWKGLAPSVGLRLACVVPGSKGWARPRLVMNKDTRSVRVRKARKAFFMTRSSILVIDVCSNLPCGCVLHARWRSVGEAETTEGWT